ncbi:hypothetical protein [Calidifontibacillus oryziterrae]|uniref:hypothetical protein n=1 Tax=Calidifontibacillus oryziterrae TaxID=1191699 RepID=UPI0003167F7F|nr:hypothetical protein [Calidifontibacillus oryziterrae]
MLKILAATPGINIGDIIYQLATFLMLLSIPIALIILYRIFKRRNKRMDRIEEKLDQLLAEKDQQN